MEDGLGELLRGWRQRRRASQLDLALDAGISSRHLSFVETGRSQPSRAVVLRLAEVLRLPLRERNRLLLAAGYAPVYQSRPLDGAAMAPARRAVERVLEGHLPYPALAVDRHWTLITANAALPPLLSGVSPALLAAPVNVLRLGLHPQGLAPRIANFAEWRQHLLYRLRQQFDATADPTLADLLEELEGYPARLPGMQRDGAGIHHEDLGGIAIPLRLRGDKGELAFISTTTVFGTALDVTLSELAIEAFFPADAATAEALRLAAGQRPERSFRSGGENRVDQGAAAGTTNPK